MINITLSGERIEKELKIYHTGYEDCSPGYGFGPFLRDHYLIHFVIGGQGVFINESGTFQVKQNQAFIIYPHEKTYYKANQDKPWSYYWIGFHGDVVEKILEETDFKNTSPIVDFKSNDTLYRILANFQDLDSKVTSHRLRQIGLLYEMFARLNELRIQPHDSFSKEWYAKQAVLYIQKNYTLGISVQEVADYLNLNRSYFSRIFKSIYGLSVQDYLIEFRIHKAKYLLIKSKFLISEVATSVGYNDSYTFTKAFKKIMHVSPSDYRKNPFI